MKRVFAFVLIASACYSSSFAEQRVARILVTTPHYEYEVYRPVADVMAGSMVRDLYRHGGLEIIEREDSEKYLKNKGLPEWVATRKVAVEVGEALNADIVIYSSVLKRGQYFNYNIAFIEVKRDVIQRVLNGYFMEHDPPQTIGRHMRRQIAQLTKYIPSPNELADPGSLIREDIVEADKIPEKHIIESYPTLAKYGIIEQLLSYYKVFPGEMELIKFEQQSRVMHLAFREEMDDELNRIFNIYRVYGDFARRHGVQAFLIKDASVRSINVLLANNIPVIFSPDGERVDVLRGYVGYREDGESLFLPYATDPFEAYDFTHRRRVAIMIIVPKPGSLYGISETTLQELVSYYKDEWNKVPTLVEMKDNFLDIITSDLK